MPSYRIGQVADLLGVSDDTARRWAHGPAGGAADRGRPAGDRRKPPWPSSWRGCGTCPSTTGVIAQSARNRFQGIVTLVVKDEIPWPRWSCRPAPTGWCR